MIKFLYPGQSIPSWMFDVVEAPNTAVPKISCFGICIKWDGVVHVFHTGTAFIKVRVSTGKTTCRMRSKTKLQIH